MYNQDCRQKWSIRKTNIAVGSVLLATLVSLGTIPQDHVHADEIGTLSISAEVNTNEAETATVAPTGTASSLSALTTSVDAAADETTSAESSTSTNGMTYFEEEEIDTVTTTEEIPKKETDSNCVKTVTKTTTTSTVSSDFEAVAEINPDGSIVTKVKSPENAAHDHSDLTYAEQYGPFDLEWNPKFGPNDTYRVNFGTNYAIKNALLTLTLPVEGYAFGQDATDWLVNRYYNNSNGTSNYDYKVYFVKDKTDEEIAALNSSSDRVIYFKAPVLSADSKTFEIDLGTLPARSAFSLEFFRDNNSLGTVEHLVGPVAKLTGTFLFEKGIILPSSTQTAALLDKEDTREAGTTIATTWTLKTTETETNGDVTAAGEEVITKNGYEYEVKTTTEIVRTNPDECGCNKIITTSEVTNNFKISAESVMDPTLPDYSNNGYLIKVANKNNHPNVTEGSVIEGPGNAEIQHWQSTKDDTTTQNWRPVLALDYPIENGQWIITLPYEVTIADITDASSWLTERYYPAVSGEKYYSNYNTVTGSNILDKITIEGNKVIVDLGDIPGRTAMALVISKTFITPEDLASNPYKASYSFEGTWKFKDINLPTTTITETIDCSCACVPKKDEDPKVPVNPTPTPERPAISTQTPKPIDSSKIPSQNIPVTPTSATKVVATNVLPATGEQDNALSIIGGSILSALALIGLGVKSKRNFD